MSQSQVPNAPNLDILTEIVTDTRTAPSSVTAVMQRIFGELYKAAGSISTDNTSSASSTVLSEAFICQKYEALPQLGVDSGSESHPLNKTMKS